MTAEAMAGAQLLKMNEEDFQKAIKEMAIKDLMETISGLQKEMAREQENFNSLSSELQNLKDRNSRQYKQISKDLVTSQQRLTLLMNKSMKCFAQIKGPMDMQNLHNSSDSTLKRRNSAKGPKPLATPAVVSTNLQRSKSLLTVNQAAIADLSSPFQSTQNPLLANSSSSAQNSMNAPHVPVIMRTTANGGVKKSHEVNFPDRQPISSGKEKERQPFSTSTESQSVTGHTGILNGPDSTKVTGAESDSQLNSGSASGVTGLYVKRKPSQQPRVVTTTNISSSKFLPPSKPLSSPPVTESATPMLFSTSAASSTNAPSSRPLTITTLSSSANDSRSLKPTPVASQPEYVSPLQMAQARKGVSKSQTFLQDNDSHGFRGLPSVKLLAQSFGSNTALNTIPGSGSGGSSSHVSKFHIANKVVYRSNSSLNLTNSQSSTSTPQFIPKSTTGGISAQTTQQEPAVFINGKTQPLVTKQFNRAPQSSAPSSNEPNEFERTRSRLRSVGREVTTETTNGNVHSSVVAPIASNRVKTPDENPNGECNDERVGEDNRIGAYVKRKDTVPGKPQSGIQTTPLSSVTVKPVNSSSLTPNNAPASTPSLNKPSSQKVPATLSSHNPSMDNSKPTFKPPALKTPQSTAPTNTHTLPANFAQKRQTPASSAANPTKSSTSPPIHTEFGARGSVVSTAAVTIRRAKSREELQQIESDSRTNKDLVLQQIQTRRRDHDGDGSNFMAMSNLSRSMPSLLSEGKYLSYALFPSSHFLAVQRYRT